MSARFLLVFLLLAAVSLSAQTFRGTILGTVTDSTGAVVAGAKVTVRNTGTGLERSTETSGDGSYSLPEYCLQRFAELLDVYQLEQLLWRGVPPLRQQYEQSHAGWICKRFNFFDQYF
jgi:hypothetical protein